MAGISKVVSVITLAEPQSGILNCGAVICTIVYIPTCPQNKPPLPKTTPQQDPSPKTDYFTAALIINP